MPVAMTVEACADWCLVSGAFGFVLGIFLCVATMDPYIRKKDKQKE